MTGPPPRCEMNHAPATTAPRPRSPSTSASSARSSNIARPASTSSMRRGGCCSTTPGCASSWAMTRRRCTSSTRSVSGTTSIIAPGSSRALRERGGELLNEEAVWKTKEGGLVHVLISYVQVAYRGGHVSFLGGKRVLWVYDVTALRQREAQVAEHERQFREILEYSPAALNIVDEEGRLLFHNARLRKLMGYDEEELHLFDTKRFWHDLDHRARIIDDAARARRRALERGGGLEDETGPARSRADFLRPGGIPRRARQLPGRQARLWLYDITALRQREAQIEEQERQFRDILEYCPAGAQRRRRGRAAPVPQCAPARAVRL